MIKSPKFFKNKKEKITRFYIKYLFDDYFWEEAKLKNKGNLHFLEDIHRKHFKKNCKSLEEYNKFLESKDPEVIVI